MTLLFNIYTLTFSFIKLQGGARGAGPVPTGPNQAPGYPLDLRLDRSPKGQIRKRQYNTEIT